MDTRYTNQDSRLKDNTFKRVVFSVVSEYISEVNIIMEDTKLFYQDLGIDERILRAGKAMGFETMTPIQEQAIPVLLEGKDIIGQAQTGTGKTAAFGIPLIQMVDPESRKLQAIVLCPTRELAMQAAEELRKLARYMHGIKILPVYGGQEIYKQIKILSQGVQIIVGTPGRVMDHLRRHTIKTSHIKMIVLDEADEMLNMGFREDIETILEDMPKEHQMALFSATMPKAILDITHTYQDNAQYIKVTPKEITVDLVKQACYRVQRKDKEEVLCRLMDYYQPEKSLIFCNTKKMVDELAEHLKGRGYQAEGLHGDLSQHQRDTVMNLFRSGKTDILIATDVAARGIDISGVDAVFNYDVPDDIEYYVHRIGRTGRAGKKGRSFTLVCGREIYKIREIERLCHTVIKERKIPSVENINIVKTNKIIEEAMEVMASKSLEDCKTRIEKQMAAHDFTALDLAAAFMKMKMGEELSEIKEEDRSRNRRYSRESSRDRSEGRSGRDKKIFQKDYNSGRSQGNKKSGHSYGKKSDKQSGERYYGRKDSKKSYSDKNRAKQIEIS